MINFQGRDCCKLLLIFHPLHASDADKISLITFHPQYSANFNRNKKKLDEGTYLCSSLSTLLGKLSNSILIVISDTLYIA